MNSTQPAGEPTIRVATATCKLCGGEIAWPGYLRCGRGSYVHYDCAAREQFIADQIPDREDSHA